MVRDPTVSAVDSWHGRCPALARPTIARMSEVVRSVRPAQPLTNVQPSGGADGGFQLRSPTCELQGSRRSGPGHGRPGPEVQPSRAAPDPERTGRGLSIGSRVPMKECRDDHCGDGRDPCEQDEGTQSGCQPR